MHGCVVKLIFASNISVWFAEQHLPCWTYPSFAYIPGLRYFILDGYELHQFDKPASATARRVVDLRGTVAKLPAEDAEAHHHTAGARGRVFPFKVTVRGVYLVRCSPGKR